MALETKEACFQCSFVDKYLLFEAAVIQIFKETTDKQAKINHRDNRVIKNM